MDDYHMVIVYRALMDYAGYEEVDRVYQFANGEYEKIYKQMRWLVIDELENMVVRPQ